MRRMRRMKKRVMTRFAAFILTVAVAAGIWTADVSAQQAMIWGDLTGDGIVAVSDALAALRAAVGLTVLSDDSFAAADVDGSGTVTTTDALLILRRGVGLIAAFPVEKSEWQVKSLTAETVEITGYAKTPPAVLSIPAEIDGKQVVSIGASAFEGRQEITEAIFPEGLTSLGDRAFADCSNLTAVSIPVSLVNFGQDAINFDQITSYEYTGVKRGLDLSYYQGTVDFSAIKASGIDFVILRAGFGDRSDQKDSKFEEYYANAKAAGLNVGAYWHSYAGINGLRPDVVEDAKLEAQMFLEAIKGKQFEYPVYMDFESKKQISAFTRRQLTDAVIASLTELENAGYYVGLYCNSYWIDDVLYKNDLTAYDKWLAHYADFPCYRNEYGGVWQYSQTGSCPGIAGKVDLDYSYRDYPTIIKEAHLNGF